MATTHQPRRRLGLRTTAGSRLARRSRIAIIGLITLLAACVTEVDRADRSAAQALDSVRIEVGPPIHGRYCDPSFGSDALPELALEPARITPHDGNGVTDTARVSIDTEAPVARVSIYQQGSCDRVAELAAPDRGRGVDWSGQSDRGGLVAPGGYLAVAVNSSGEALAASTLIVGRQDTRCAGTFDDPDQASSTLATRIKLDALTRQTFDLDVGEPGWLCLTITRLDAGDTRPVVAIDDVPIFSPDVFTAATRSVRAAVPVDRTAALSIAGADLSVRIEAGFVADSRPPSAQSLTAVDHPNQVTCSGRLLSHPHPFGLDARPSWPGLSADRFIEGRRPVPRGGIRVQCVVQFEPTSARAATVVMRTTATGFAPDLPAFPSVYAPAITPMAADLDSSVNAPGSSDQWMPLARRLNSGALGIPGFDPLPGGWTSIQDRYCRPLRHPIRT